MKNATAHEEHDLPGRHETAKEWIFMRDIYVDSRYQRPLNDSRVTSIQVSFDPDALGLPFVVETRDGGSKTRYAIIDGQHRIEAARRLFGNAQMIECEIIRNITIERAADLFRRRNQAHSPTALDKFLAGVTAKNEECLAINGIVQSVGLSVQRKDGDLIVRAVASLLKVYRGQRAELQAGQTTTPKNALPLKRALVVLSEAWGPGRDAFQGDLIHGVGMVLTRDSDSIELEELIRKLKTYPGGALKMVGDARNLRSIVGGSIGSAVAMRVIERYNTGRRTKTLPPWREGKPQAAQQQK